ncbi:ABC transporter permease subunit [Streptomyces sp. NPDC093097]|uniref:ABC transporter permease subunit n=1 Tax=Streptomyces sp. NPDC093097 TaxID=3366027 RepID=UPI0038229332
MRLALAYEWCRLRTLRSTWWLAVTTLLVTAALAWAFGALLGNMATEVGQAPPVTEALVIMLTKSPVTPVIAGVLGVFAMGHEHRYGTIRTTLAVTPHRVTAFAAKALSIGAFSTLLAFANLAVAWLVALPLIGGDRWEGVSLPLLVRVHLGQVLLVLGWGLAGVALGTMIRSQTAALLTLLAVPLVVEPMLRAALRSSGQALLTTASSFLPFTAGNAMTGVPGTDGTLLDNASQLGPLAGGLAFFAVIALKGVSAVMLFRTRDA